MTFRSGYDYDFIITAYRKYTEPHESQSNNLERLCLPDGSISCDSLFGNFSLTLAATVN